VILTQFHTYLIKLQLIYYVLILIGSVLLSIFIVASISIHLFTHLFGINKCFMIASIATTILTKLIYISLIIAQFIGYLNGYLYAYWHDNIAITNMNHKNNQTILILIPFLFHLCINFISIILVIIKYIKQMN
jgi:hypothetical protein